MSSGLHEAAATHPGGKSIAWLQRTIDAADASGRTALHWCVRGLVGGCVPPRAHAMRGEEFYSVDYQGDATVFYDEQRHGAWRRLVGGSSPDAEKSRKKKKAHAAHGDGGRDTGDMSEGSEEEDHDREAIDLAKKNLKKKVITRKPVLDHEQQRFKHDGDFHAYYDWGIPNLGRDENLGETHFANVLGRKMNSSQASKTRHKKVDEAQVRLGNDDLLEQASLCLLFEVVCTSSTVSFSTLMNYSFDGEFI